MTQLFADCLLQEQGLLEGTNHNYGASSRSRSKLVPPTNFDMVARAYFLNDATLRETMRGGSG